ncbi:MULTISPECIES: FG-GAP repeat domain-containing protein [Clostridium]|uniref:FG-GAP repeat domain-containing protein n=1 Tax=Clostridium TaxID=1485 RepID=UPI00077D79B4|nr:MULTISPECIES: VCBS repeat-containing protein [Clostridium]MBE6042932.1 VCBS repeat-containing protein [Clostridium thermopalmarium]
MLILKFKVLFLKRKQIYYFLLIVIVLIFFGFSILSDNRTSYTTFSIGSIDKVYKSDLTGDGKQDVLYITLNKDKYCLQVNTEKDSFYLEPSKNLASVGNYCPYWPMRVNILDISRDKIPEIFIQSSKENRPIQHVFLYEKNRFKDIFCSYNNILGFIDCTNNKTPKMISGNISKNNFSFSNYILLQGKLERYNYRAEETFMGKDTILSFINAITSLNPENIQLPQEIFDPKTYDKALPIIESMANSSSNFIFQDASFIDTKSNKDGDPIQVEWTLNFRANSIKSLKDIRNHTLKLKLNFFKDSKEKYCFKISSLYVKK